MTTGYRIRNLVAEKKGETPVVGGNVASSRQPGSITFAGKLLRTLGSPRLTDAIHHPRHAERLAALWPTFTYLQVSQFQQPIKTAPTRLAAHLPAWSSDDEGGLLAGAVHKVAAEQAADNAAIDQIVRAHNRNTEPSLAQSAVAMALASTLFRGSDWLRKNQSKLLSIILESPHAAYVALASGVWTAHASDLLRVVGGTPPLVLQVLKSPELRSYAAEEWIRNSLIGHPVYRAAASCIQHENEPKTCALLEGDANHDAFAAAVCWAFNPAHSQAQHWWQRIRKEPEWLYWAGRAWRASQHLILEIPKREEILAVLTQSPRWLYHWARDLEPYAAEIYAERLWPDPWSIELMADLRLPPDLLCNLVATSKLDDDDYWYSSILLWGAHYVKSQ